MSITAIRKAPKDALGDRMKAFEAQETSRRFLPGLPICVRIDGRGFSQLTRDLKRPYDMAFHELMVEVTRVLVEETSSLIGYVQSDEISLLWEARMDRYGLPQPLSFFDRKITKATSVVASLAASAFMRGAMRRSSLTHLVDRLPHFDARVIQMPSRREAANMMLWRNQDATKNAVSMLAHHHFNHASLQGVSSGGMQERLLLCGINFNDEPSWFRRGTWVRMVTEERPLTDVERSRIPENRRPAADATFSRRRLVAFDAPRLGAVTNRVGFLFDGHEPTVAVDDGVRAAS